MAEEEEEVSESDSEENLRESTSFAVNCNNDECDIPDYEKQRLSRIKENRERLEALGLPALASSLLTFTGKETNAKGKGKKLSSKIREDDDEYRPSEGEENESSSDEEDDNENGDNEGDGLSGSRRSIKGKGKISFNAAKLTTTLPIQSDVDELDLIDDDASLQQAIALSLGAGVPLEKLPSMNAGFFKNSGTTKDASGCRVSQEGVDIPGGIHRTKRRKQHASRIKLTEDEVVAYFFSFDESGKGMITARDLWRVAGAHDFIWTDKEITDMIDCFDSDRDGKLSLGDFQTIVAQCNMMQSSGNDGIGSKQ